MLLTQGLGLHHAVAHGATGSPGVVEPTQVQADATALGAGPESHLHTATETAPLATPSGAFHADHGAGDAQCRLVDQLGHAELLWLSLPMTSVVPANRLVQAVEAWASPPDAARAPYQARGPP